MARMCLLELHRFRHSIFSNPTLLIFSSKFPNQFSSPFYSTEPKTLDFPHLTLSFLESCQDLRRLFQIHAHLITSGLIHNNATWEVKLLKHSSDFPDTDYVFSILKRIDRPGTFCVNTVIKAYSFSSFPHQAVAFYFQMLNNNERFIPNSYTFVQLLVSCAKSGCFKSALKCHGQAFKFGVTDQLTVQNSLIHMYGCFGDIEFAKKVLGEMSDRDIVTWNSFIAACVKVWDLSLAHKLFDEMPNRNVVSWNIMINGFSKSGNPGLALKLFRKMVETRLAVNEKTMVSVLSACCRSARLKEGRSVHGFFIKSCLRSNIIIDTALIDLYCNCRKVELARMMFDEIKNRNLVCWNAMILGHCIHGKPEDGLQLFMDMVEQSRVGGYGISPDEITFIGVLCACARAGLLEEGINYFSQMINNFGIKPNFAHFWCMANLYVGANLVQEAEEILRQMPDYDDDVSSESMLWANLLSSCRFGQGVAVGEKLAASLIAKDFKNFSYYQLLLNVYAVAGKWEEVAKVKQMIKERKIERIPGCNLLDLKDIVHDLKVGEDWQNGVDKLAHESSYV